MKKIILIFLVGIFVLPTLNSCKKGENDPSISLKSRKARLVGEWKLTEGTIVENNGATITNFTFNGTTAVVSGASNGSWAYTQSVTFEKDGTFTINLFEDGDQTMFEGNWYFLGANKEDELKDKEAIDLVYKKITETPAGGIPSTWTITGFAGIAFYNGLGISYKIDKLSSKEIVLLVDWTVTTTTTVSRKGTLTYTK